MDHPSDRKSRQLTKSSSVFLSRRSTNSRGTGSRKTDESSNAPDDRDHVVRPTRHREGRGNNAILRRVPADAPRQDLFVKVSDGRVFYGSSCPPGRRRIHEQGLAFGEQQSNFVQADLAVEPCAMGLEHRPRLGRHKYQIHQYAKQEGVSHEERLLRGRLAKRSKSTFSTNYY